MKDFTLNFDDDSFIEIFVGKTALAPKPVTKMAYAIREQMDVAAEPE